MTLLSPHAFEQRLAQLETRLDHLGITTINLSGRKHRTIRAVAVAPGVAGLPEVARFAYEECFRRLSDGSLLRVKYAYNYFDLAVRAWRGYHLHEIRPGAGPVPHAKCVVEGGAGDPLAHYFAYEVDLWAAHDEFERQYASGQAIDCRGLSLRG